MTIYSKLASIFRYSHTTAIKSQDIAKSKFQVSRLRRLTKNKNNLKIHLGCGPRVLKGWVNIDLQYEPYHAYMKYYTNEFYGPNVRGNKKDFFALNIISQPLPIPSGSVKIIFHEDLIEHLNQKEQFLLLAESLRILKKGGVHRINTPDIVSSMKLNSQFQHGYTGVYKEEWENHIHKNVLSVSSLKEMALLVGYSKVLVQNRNKSVGEIPKEYRPDLNDRLESGNIFVDLIK